MTRIPTSGAFLRAFAGSSMTPGTRHVAEVIASSISYDGKYRGAPKGHAAFTMGELQKLTGLAARTIQIALKELAQLFGLTILKRHHKRHFFRFTRITETPQTHRTDSEVPEVAQDEQTRTQLRVPPYIEEQRNNNCSPKVKIKEGVSVYQTPWATFIDRFKQGTPAEQVDTQFLWNGFCGLNRRNGHESVPLRFLIGFLSKYPRKKQGSSPNPTEISAPPAPSRTVTPDQRRLIEMAQAAPFANRHFHKSALQSAIGMDAYEARVERMTNRYRASRFSAELAVHGEAVTRGEIAR